MSGAGSRRTSWPSTRRRTRAQDGRRPPAAPHGDSHSRPAERVAWGIPPLLLYAAVSGCPRLAGTRARLAGTPARLDGTRARLAGTPARLDGTRARRTASVVKPLCSLGAYRHVYSARSLVAYLELRCHSALLDGVKAQCPGNVSCSWRISRYVQGRARGYHAEQAGTPKPAGSPL